MDKKIYNELIEYNKICHRNTKHMHDYDFHLHDFYEIIFFIDVSGKYLINKNVYHIKSGQVAVTNTEEIHSLVFDKNHSYERVIIHFSPYFLKQSSIDSYDLEQCFSSRENGKNNVIDLNPIQISEFTEIYNRLEKINKNKNEKGNLILKYSVLLEILVFINNAFMNYELGISPYKLPDNLFKIISYINENIAEDLSLETLGSRFYINSTHLAAIFKKHTGTTIHQYIIYTRISYAKKLLKKGFNVTETCLRCGFNDYTNFIKAFKKITGISPGRYKLNF